MYFIVFYSRTPLVFSILGDHLPPPRPHPPAPPAPPRPAPCQQAPCSLPRKPPLIPGVYCKPPYNQCPELGSIIWGLLENGFHRYEIDRVRTGCLVLVEKILYLYTPFQSKIRAHSFPGAESDSAPPNSGAQVWTIDRAKYGGSVNKIQ